MEIVDIPFTKSSDLLTVASINATILAISIAALGIVVSMLGDKALSVFQEILEKQPSIVLSYQDIDYRAFMLYGKNEPKFNTEDDDTRRTVITSVLQAAMGADCFSPPSCPTPAETGSTIVTSLSALMAHYPFSVQSGTGPQSITSLLKWQEDMHTALSGLAHLDGYRGQLLQMVEKYQQTVNIPPRDVRESQSKDFLRRRQP